MAWIPRDVKDQVVQYPNRFKIDGVSHTIEPDFGVVTEPGTPINKAFLQPAEDFLASLYTEAVGDIRQSLTKNADPNWLLCNGEEFLEADYPALGALLKPSGDNVVKTNPTPIPMSGSVSKAIKDICYGNGYYVALMENGGTYILYTTNPANGWTGKLIHSSTNRVSSISFQNGRFIIAAAYVYDVNNYTNYVFYATDPSGTWTNVTSGLTGFTYGSDKLPIIYTGTQYVLFGLDGGYALRIAYSTDLNSWTVTNTTSWNNPLLSESTALYHNGTYYFVTMLNSNPIIKYGTSLTSAAGWSEINLSTIWGTSSNRLSNAVIKDGVMYVTSVNATTGDFYLHRANISSLTSWTTKKVLSKEETSTSDRPYILFTGNALWGFCLTASGARVFYTTDFNTFATRNVINRNTNPQRSTVVATPSNTILMFNNYASDYVQLTTNSMIGIKLPCISGLAYYYIKAK